MRLFQLSTVTAVLSTLSLFGPAHSLPASTTGVSDTTKSTTQNTVWYGDKQITYYTQGPPQGPALIFLHGWPAIAETWRSQIDYFSNLGYFVVAPDMPGYGRSTARNVTSDYSLENIVTGMLAMLEDTGRKSAVWVGHDWGASVTSSIAAVHPEVVDAMAWLNVPYKTNELGYEYMRRFNNHTIYPEDEFPYAQWDYQKYYQTQAARVASVFESDYEYAIKFLYTSSGGNASVLGTRAFSTYITGDNGWFCGADSLPPSGNVTCSSGEAPPPPSIPLNATVLNEDISAALVTALKNTSFVPADAYYLNQQANFEYNTQQQKNDGRLDFPCLFIQGDYDLICATIDTTLLDPMVALCKDYSFASLPTGHWTYEEAPDGTNTAIANWLAANVTGSKPSATHWENIPW